MSDLQKQLNDVKTAIGNIVASIEKGIVFDELTDRYNALKVRKDEIERKIENHQRTRIHLSKKDIESVLKAYIQPMVENNYEDAKKLILEEFVHHAVLFDDYVVVYFSFLNTDKTPISKEYKINPSASINSTDKPSGSPQSTIVETDGIVFVCFPFRISK